MSLYLSCTVTQTSNLVPYKEIFLFVVINVPTTKYRKQKVQILNVKPGKACSEWAFNNHLSSEVAEMETEVLYLLMLNCSLFLVL